MPNSVRWPTGKGLASWVAVAGLVLGGAGSAWARVELTMYYPVAVGGPLTKIIDGLAADFGKEHPDIKVNAIYAGNYDDARIKALAALKAGQPAQLSVLFSIDLFELIEQDAILPFDDLVQTAEDRAWLKSFFPAFMENGLLKGKTWGIPFQRSTIVMYWNKAAFREAGLDPERPPATWADLAETGKRLVKRDAAGQVQRWGVMIPSTGYPYWMFQALSLQNGQVLMNPEGNRTFYDAPPVVDALQYWVDLSRKDRVMPEGTVEWGTLRQQFLEGKTAIMWHTTGNLTAVKTGAQFEFGVAMLPAKERRGSPTGGGNFYVFKKTTPEERKAALTFIKWITAPERAARWSIDTGYVAVRPDAYDTAVLRQYVVGFPAAAVARDQLKFATAELSTYEGGRVRKALDDAIQSALTGAKTPKEALGAAQQQADRLLRRYR
jgi:sn-glycerol 3-phosphate transport system substrate-binding protein